MVDDTENISRKSWIRNVKIVSKIGYMDGAADGQAAVFQSSFDMGYKQGFSFGIQLGLNSALKRSQQKDDGLNSIQDPRKINCQLCITGIPSQQNVVNLYNFQQEKNTEILNQKQLLEND